MKKIIKLTESDLTKIVRRVIKENVEEGNYCEYFIEDMEDLFDKYVEYLDTTTEEIDADYQFDIFERELSDLLYMANEMNCDNYDELESSAQEYTMMMFKVLKLD